MKKKIGLLAIIGLLVTFMAFSGVASAQASNVQVLFFTQPGCSACAAAEPIVQAAVAKYGVSLVTYNYADPVGKGVAQANGVSETPTIIISGAQSARFEGSVTPAQMESAIKAAIGTTTVKQAVAVVKATPTPVATPIPVKQAVAVVKAEPTATKQVKAVKAVAVTTAKEPTIEVVTAKPTSTAATKTVPEFPLIGLGAPALLVGAIYLFLRRR